MYGISIPHMSIHNYISIMGVVGVALVKILPFVKYNKTKMSFLVWKLMNWMLMSAYMAL